MKKIISFPNLDNYFIPIKYLFTKLTNIKVMVSPKITQKTIELGDKYSPEFVCLPFKYNLGNYIEALNNGANILIQFGGGCRYSFYAELQEQILKDLGYNFKFYTFVLKGKIKIKRVYNIFKELNDKINIFKFSYYFILTFYMILTMDKIDKIIRKRIGFEKSKNSFNDLKKAFLNDLAHNKGFISILFIEIKYKRLFKKLEIIKEKKCLKIGIIGELFTSMEPFSSYFLEEELAKMNIEIKRFTNVSYLLLFKKLFSFKVLNSIKDYDKYRLGADASDNIYRTKYLIKKKYDGIIHIKPFGCTPEITIIPIIEKICNQNKIPVIFFSFDTQTSLTGIKTRLEAFYDMLKMKKGDYNESIFRN